VLSKQEPHDLIFKIRNSICESKHLALCIKNQFTPVHTSFLLTIIFSFVSMRLGRIMNMHQPMRYGRQGEDSIIIYRQSGFAFIPTTYDLVLSGQLNFTCLLVYIPKVCRKVCKWKRSGHPDFSGRG